MHEQFESVMWCWWVISMNRRDDDNDDDNNNDEWLVVSYFSQAYHSKVLRQIILPWIVSPTDQTSVLLAHTVWWWSLLRCHTQAAVQLTVPPSLSVILSLVQLGLGEKMIRWISKSNYGYDLINKDFNSSLVHQAFLFLWLLLLIFSILSIYPTVASMIEANIFIFQS